MSPRVGETDAIAVVIPAYRATATIDATLASVAAQTLPPAEVIVVDDESGDRTAEIAGRWHGRLPITVIEHDRNRGPAAARRTAIDRSTAPFLAFLDADDLWFPDHLEQLAQVVHAAGGAATADAYRWREGSRILRKTHRDLVPVPGPAAQRRASLRANFVFIGSMCARSDYDAAGGFRDGFSGAEDWDLWIRMIRRGVVFRQTASPTCVYRLADEGLTAGPAIFDRYVAVLQSARSEAEDDSERAVIDRTLVRLRARRALLASYDSARSGDVGGARSLARTATGGGPMLRAEALALRMSPRAASALGDAARHRFRWGPRTTAPESGGGEDPQPS